jgi:hypothetical protein
MHREDVPAFCFELDRGARLRVNEASLKSCDLCGALNLLQNGECFVCGWRGHFSRNQSVIHETLIELIRSLPEVSPLHFTDDRTLRRIFRRRPWWVRMVDAVRWWFEAPRSVR